MLKAITFLVGYALAISVVFSVMLAIIAGCFLVVASALRAFGVIG